MALWSVVLRRSATVAFWYRRWQAVGLSPSEGTALGSTNRVDPTSTRSRKPMVRRIERVV